MASMAHYRRSAIGAARTELRRMGENPSKCSAEQALRVLDDLAQSEPELEASFWYSEASENQILLFGREWRRKAHQWV